MKIIPLFAKDPKDMDITELQELLEDFRAQMVTLENRMPEDEESDEYEEWAEEHEDLEDDIDDIMDLIDDWDE